MKLFRKAFLALCMAGKIIGAIFNLLNAIFLTSWSRWVWLATVMPIQNISGGYLTFIMMTYSFIADNSTNRSLQGGHKKGFMLNAFFGHPLYTVGKNNRVFF